jgi:serine/threonine protein kinase
LGEGGYGKVKLAQHMETNKLYALKLLVKHTPGRREKLRSEAEIMEGLVHDHIGKFVEYCHDVPYTKKSDGSVHRIDFLVVELLTSGSLFDVI